MARIELKGINKSYGASRALRDLDLVVEDGEFFVLLGRTGAGKTTTLRMIAGLEKPDSGSITIGGRDVSGMTAAERDVALVLQQYSLYPRLTVRGNLEFPLRAPGRKFSDAEIASRVEKAATTLQITHLLDRKVERLSGGEMQRVSIGRAIVRQPSVFLMDEPLSALDAKLRESLRVELKKLHGELGATFLFVTHDQVEAMSMGDKIGVLRQGRLVQVGTPADIYERPLNTFVARSVGSPPMNLINGRLAGGMAELGAFQLPIAANAAGSGAVTFGVRPENVVLAPGAPGEARIFDIEDQGVVKILVMDMGEARLH
ncbi:MAG: ABC transporter ATP-binding protein, partial [Pseudomonadota bacterium]